MGGVASGVAIKPIVKTEILKGTRRSAPTEIQAKTGL